MIYIFKTLRYVANSSIIRMVCLSLCQSILSYCIVSWGGAPTTTLKPLEIAQRAILKISTFKPTLFPTNVLYRECETLNVRQLFILQVISIQHSLTPFVKNNKRRKDRICTIPIINFNFCRRFLPFIGPYLYNKINSIISIHQLTHNECLSNTTTFLQNLTYEETEKLLNLLDS